MKSLFRRLALQSGILKFICSLGSSVSFFCCAILGSALVFVEKQEKADMLFKDLLKTSYPCLSLHGGKIYDVLSKREVKMTGYWPSSFFAYL